MQNSSSFSSSFSIFRAGLSRTFPRRSSRPADKSASLRPRLLGAIFPLLCAVAALAGPSNAPSATATNTKAAAAEPEIPKSVFILPAGPKDGRDPFFPNRVLGYKVAQTNQAPIQAVTLLLNGVGGTRDHRLCIINGQTFGPGDEEDVKTPDGRKVKIRCLEVKEESVIIQVDGERRELRLRRGL